MRLLRRVPAKRTYFVLMTVQFIHPRSLQLVTNTASASMNLMTTLDAQERYGVVIDLIRDEQVKARERGDTDPHHQPVEVWPAKEELVVLLYHVERQAPERKVRRGKQS